MARDANAAGDPVLVRRLTPGDIELFRSVRLAALEDSPEAFGETLDSAERADWVARTASGSAFTDRGAFVALASGAAVGMVFVRCEASPAPAFLGGMWVHPQFRRQGVGRMLVLRAFDFLRSIGQVQVSLWVTRSHAEVLTFYRSLGFLDTGRTDHLRPGSNVPIVELTLDLTSASLPR